MTLDACRLLELPRIDDARGSLTFVEGGRHVPFAIARTYYLYDVPPGTRRGAHGHKTLEQLVVAVNGAFDITLDDGANRQQWRLDSPNHGLYIAPMIWRAMENFAPASVCLVLASAPYDEADYIRDYPSFLAAGRDIN